MKMQEENIKDPDSGFKWKDQYHMHLNSMVVENHRRAVIMPGTHQSYSTSTFSSRSCMFSSLACILHYY